MTVTHSFKPGDRVEDHLGLGLVGNVVALGDGIERFDYAIGVRWDEVEEVSWLTADHLRKIT